jgi:hypothetical protein
MDHVDDLVQQWAVSEFAGMGYTSEQMRAHLGEVIDQLYDDYVDRPRMQEDGEIRYSMSVFNANRTTPPDVLSQRYTDLHGRLTKFRNILRNESVSLLAGAKGRCTEVDAALHVEVTDRVSRVFEALDAMYELVRGCARMRQTQVLSNAYPEYPARFLPGEKKDKDLHYLQRWVYKVLFDGKFRRWEGRIMKPIYTTAGHLTRTYTYHCDIDDFFKVFMRREREYDIWQVGLFKGNRANVISTLKETTDPLFDDLVRKRYYFTFDNCGYDAKNNKVLMYTQTDWNPNEMEGYTTGAPEYRQELVMSVRGMETITNNRLPGGNSSSNNDDDDDDDDGDEDRNNNLGAESINTTIGQDAAPKLDNHAAANHFPMDFPIEHLHTEPMDIPTPTLDSIFESQGYMEQHENWSEILMWIYGLMGRMIYDVSAADGGDNWQIALFFKGLAGTGKGCLMRAILRKLYQVSDVGILSNNIERKFGLEGLAKSWIVLCMEMRGNFSLDIGEFLSMVAAEDMKVARKNKIALQLIWSSPMCIAGNTTANWTDEGGSLGRRLVPVPFNHYVSKADSTLDDRLCEEFPLILLKINKCYHKIRKLVEANGHNFWGTIPKFFVDERDKLITQINTFEQFLLGSGVCQVASEMNVPQEDYYWEWIGLTKAYKSWCNDSSAIAIDVSKADGYAMVVQKLGIKIENKMLQDPISGSNIRKNWAIGVRPASAAIVE